MSQSSPYCRPNLAYVHDRGYSFHADGCASGILELLEPVRRRKGLVLELGCGSGHLTRHLTVAGHRVLATDASPAMLDLTRQRVPGAEVRQLSLPDDPIPEADAIVSSGHAVSYVSDPAAMERAFGAIARALRPGGAVFLDVMDLHTIDDRVRPPSVGRVGEDWAIVANVSSPRPDQFVRDMAVFVRNDDGTWRRDDEQHVNTLFDTSRLPALLADHGIEATLVNALGAYQLPPGLVGVVGHKATAT